MLFFYVEIVGILISGGGLLSSAEVYIPSLQKSCSLPSLRASRYRHTQNNLLACGGFGSDTATTCELYSPGVGWRPEPYTLAEERRGHSSWTLSNGSVVLLGGEGTTRTEVLTPGVGTRPGFPMRYPTS